MRCPKCDYIQDSGSFSCLSCGVIFSKIYKNPPIGSLYPLDAEGVKNIRELNDSLIDEKDKFKLIYKSIKMGLNDLPTNTEINEHEKAYYIKLVKNKLKHDKVKHKFSLSIYLAVTVLSLILLIYFLL